RYQREKFPVAPGHARRLSRLVFTMSAAFRVARSPGHARRLSRSVFTVSAAFCAARSPGTARRYREFPLW
ncbi:hypothetical protein, partial [Stenotrophomonas indicatrix]|uniref:hypothetical protein n=1 Tax=Stenotrophomonas indicatrix TaxID=2045451 RepID=UPI003D6D79BA